MFKSWNDYTVREQLLTLISDVYKDLNGFRPRRSFDEMSDADLGVYLARLQADLTAEVEEEIENNEKLIASVIALGAGNRETAIRWIENSY